MKQAFKFIVFLFLLSNTVAAQPNDFSFGMGIPEGKDEGYDKLMVKARLTTDNYRAVGSKGSLKDYAPTPRSQGSYGTCTAWAVGFCARTILEAQRNGWTTKSKIDANTFSPGFIYRVTTSRSSCNGSYVSECVKRLEDTGIPKFTDFEEQCPQSSIPSSVYTKAKKYKIKGFATLWNTYQTATEKEKVQLVKKSISEGNPIVIAMVVPNSFCYSKGPVWVPKITDSPQGNQGHQHGRHAMCIVGYDDDEHGGAFLLQNSWGSNWGNKGYMWVKYKDAADYIYQAIEVYQLAKIKKDETVKLAGSLRLEEDTGQEMTASLQSDNTYKLKKAYRSGTRFRIYLNNKQSAYVYAFGSDLSSKVFPVFPYAKGVSPFLNYDYNSVPIPSETKHIRMDGNTGTDYLCVLYSKVPLDIKSIQRKIEGQSSRYSFKQKVANVLGSKLIKSSNISYTDNGKMSFSAVSKGEPVAAIFMEMEHID